MTCQRLGVFGGTFDPPHNGHLRLAREALKDLALDRLLWVITPDPPHKIGRSISPLPLRLEMLQAALLGEPAYEISLVDAHRPGPQYTVDTLRILKKDNPTACLIFLMGGDSLHDLPTWYKPQELLAEVTELGILRRPADDLDLPHLEARLPGLKAKLRYIRTWRTAVSSTRVRSLVQHGKSITHLVPQAVADIILREGLYRETEAAPGQRREPHPPVTPEH